MNCADLTPWDVIRWRGVRGVWRNQDFGIVGPRIRVSMTLGAAATSLQLANGTVSVTNGLMARDVNITEYMPNDGKYWFLFRAVKLEVRSVETQLLSALGLKLASATLTHQPKGKAPYVHSLGFDAIGSDLAIPSYGPAADPAAIGAPAALQPNWRNMAGWFPVDMESDSLIFAAGAAVGLVDAPGFLDFDSWAVRKEDVKDHDVKLGRSALSRHFQEMKAKATEQINRVFMPTRP